MINHPLMIVYTQALMHTLQSTMTMILHNPPNSPIITAVSCPFLHKTNRWNKFVTHLICVSKYLCGLSCWEWWLLTWARWRPNRNSCNSSLLSRWHCCLTNGSHCGCSWTSSWHVICVRWGRWRWQHFCSSTTCWTCCMNQLLLWGNQSLCALTAIHSNENYELHVYTVCTGWEVTRYIQSFPIYKGGFFEGLPKFSLEQC